MTRSIHSSSIAARSERSFIERKYAEVFTRLCYKSSRRLRGTFSAQRHRTGAPAGSLDLIRRLPRRRHLRLVGFLILLPSEGKHKYSHS